jgi:hypothetical protein
MRPVPPHVRFPRPGALRPVQSGCDLPRGAWPRVTGLNPQPNSACRGSLGSLGSGAPGSLGSPGSLVIRPRRASLGNQPDFRHLEAVPTPRPAAVADTAQTAAAHRSQAGGASAANRPARPTGLPWHSGTSPRCLSSRCGRAGGHIAASRPDERAPCAAILIYPERMNSPETDLSYSRSRTADGSRGARLPQGDRACRQQMGRAGEARAGPGAVRAARAGSARPCRRGDSDRRVLRKLVPSRTRGRAGGPQDGPRTAWTAHGFQDRAARRPPWRRAAGLSGRGQPSPAAGRRGGRASDRARPPRRRAPRGARAADPATRSAPALRRRRAARRVVRAL